MFVILIVFWAFSTTHVFFLSVNLVNLFQQSAVFMVLAMAEGFALVLGEIDLSVGFVGACGAAITVQLVQPLTTNWHWTLGILAGVLFCAAFGVIQGTLITRLRLPSFIVTLGGYLIANGLFLWILNFGPFSGYPNLAGFSNNLQVIYNLMWGTIDPTVSWILAAVVVAGLGFWMWFSDHRRRTSGLVAPPASLTLIKIGLIAVVAVVVVGICNTNRASRGGHRRHEPLRRPGQGPPRRAWRPRDRRHLQRHVPDEPFRAVGIRRHGPGPPGRGHDRLAVPPRGRHRERRPGLVPRARFGLVVWRSHTVDATPAADDSSRN